MQKHNKKISEYYDRTLKGGVINVGKDQKSNCFLFVMAFLFQLCIKKSNIAKILSVPFLSNIYMPICFYLVSGPPKNIEQ